MVELGSNVVWDRLSAAFADAESVFGSRTILSEEEYDVACNILTRVIEDLFSEGELVMR